MPFNDLREFIEAARSIGDLKEIHGAHWDLEIGALTEVFVSREPDRKSTRLNSSHIQKSRMPSSA